MLAMATRLLALGGVLVVTSALTPQAWADPDYPVIPSKQEIAAAEHRVELTMFARHEGRNEIEPRQEMRERDGS